MKYSGAAWLNASTFMQGRQVSDFGAEVANILGFVFRGLYHLRQRTLARVEWHRDDVIEITIDRDELATYDGTELTELVILAHDRSIRFAVSPAMNRLRLCFHHREPAHEHTWGRHWSMEAALERTRKHFLEPRS